MKNPDSTISVKLDTSPLNSGHVLRGIGVYTRLLSEYLAKVTEITVITAKSDKQKVDLVHYPFFDLFFPTLPIKPWLKTIVTIHDVIPLVFPKQYLPGKKGALMLKRQRVALTFVSTIITDSEASKTDIHTYLHVPLEKIQVVYLAGQPELMPATEIEIKQLKKRLGLTKPYVLYVGDINYNKNIPQLIKMLKYLPPNIELVCFGKAMKQSDIPEWQAIITQAALSNVENRLHFISDIDSSDFQSLSALYGGALCYVQPSLYEGFGLPVLEAMQCATPVVATNTSSLPEIVGKNGILVDPEAEALAAGVLSIYQLAISDRQKMIERGIKHARTFSWNKTAQLTAEVYRRALGR